MMICSSTARRRSPDIPQNDCKGIIISDGDVLALCIRLFSELLLQRYQISLPEASESLLALHAVSLFEENSALLEQLPQGHHSQTFNALILPEAEHAIEAMGHSMAYSAGVQKGLPKRILDVYECAVIRRDPAWYSERGGLTRCDQHVCEDDALTRAIPRLAAYLDDLRIEAYVSAPIISDAAWKKYYNSMPVFKENAETPFDQGIQAKLYIVPLLFFLESHFSHRGPLYNKTGHALLGSG